MICFFGNLDEYKDFSKRNFGIDIDCERLEKKRKKKINNLTVYFSKSGVIKVISNVAHVIKADNNPFY